MSLVELTSTAGMWQLCSDIALCVAPYLEESSHWWDLEVVYKHGMDAALELGDRRLEEKVSHGLGIVLRDRGDFQESAEYLQAALAICHEIIDPPSEAKLRGDIAVPYQYTGQSRRLLESLASLCVYLTSAAMSAVRAGHFVAWGKYIET